MVTIIGDIVEKTKTINPSVKNKEIDKLFTENPQLQGLVVTKNMKPIAQVTRTHFYQKIGTLYGYNLYMGRENSLIAKTNPLIVDYSQPITEVSTRAMQRKEEDLFDDVIVVKDDTFLGIVSIRTLLMKFVEIQVEFASFLNPLSKLPGNHLIDKKLCETLLLEQFSLLYFDLDNFKGFNDMYGFNKGDKLLLYFSELLKKHLAQLGYFLGHIGGDDFIAIVPHYVIEELCAEIINDFDQSIQSFYDPAHLANPAFQVKGRSGKTENFHVVSLSIAVVTNQQRQFGSIDQLSDFVAAIKRKCKAQKGSCFLINEE